jgi:DNA-directed RNA polymerase specialized sigma24 family protein
MALSTRRRGMPMSFGGLFVRFEAQSAPSTSPHPPFTVHDEKRDVFLNRCFKRICTWRVPPNWSVADWREEIRAHGLAAACEACCDFDPSRGVPLDAFVYRRVITRAYTRFRQEWAYGLRCISDTWGGFADGGCVSLPSESRVQCRASSVEAHPVYQALRDALGSLSESNQQIILQLFWEGRTEANIAEMFKISHQAVSKRKWAVIKKLRTWFDVKKKENSHWEVAK